MPRKQRRRFKPAPSLRSVRRSYASYVNTQGQFDRAMALAADGDSAAACALLEQLEDEPRLSTRLRLQAREMLTRLGSVVAPVVKDDQPSIKVAIVSFLFNWPTTGGGNIHTWELAKFLSRAGYDVRHIFVRYEPWGIGRCDDDPPFDSIALEFNGESWNRNSIQSRIRRAVESYDPDCVIITDSWNFKPHLAAAVEGYPYLLRMQALECLCPLNNLRVLPGSNGAVLQCPRDQLSAPFHCGDCLLHHGGASGGLHQAERALSGVGSADYDYWLRRAVKNAETVLCLNHQIAEMYRSDAQRVDVVTWGMDADRFPKPKMERNDPGLPLRLLFAGLTDEFIKGFHILHDACKRLWSSRQDFELVVTSGRPGRVDAFTRRIGWHSQADLPAVYRDADVCVVPTVVQDGLSRTSVEAMASGLPVVGSRIGGLPETVTDGVTGLLAEPGDAEDLADKLGRLLDSADLRRDMGRAGRKVFEERFTWPVVIERQYRPLLKRKIVSAAVSNLT